MKAKENELQQEEEGLSGSTNNINKKIKTERLVADAVENIYSLFDGQSMTDLLLTNEAAAAADN